MKSSNELFDLIKSLSPSEKRFFKIYASRHVIGEENNYVALFEAIDNLEVYDEDYLLTKHKGAQFTENLSRSKNYLTNLIIKSLRSYHDQANVKIELRNLLTDIEILFKKSQFQLATKLLKKARQIVDDYSLLWQSSEVLDKEKILLYAWLPNHDDKNSGLRANIEKQMDIVNKIKTQHDFTLFYSRMAQLADSFWDKSTEEENSELKKLTSSEFFTDDYLPPTPNAKLHQLLGRVIYYTHEYDAEKGTRAIEEYYNFLLNHEYLKPVYPLLYLTHFRNCIFALLRFKKYKEAVEGIKKLRNLITEAKKDLIHHSQQYVLTSKINMELLYFKLTGQFEQGIESFLHLKNSGELATFTNHNSVLTDIYYNISICYFGAGNYQHAITWLKYLSNTLGEDLNKSQFLSIKLLHILAQYEAGEFDDLEYLIRNTLLSLKKSNKAFAAEISIATFMNKLILDRKKRNQAKFFIEQKEKLTEIFKNGKERNLLVKFDYLSWLDSKIENKSFAEIIKQRELGSAKLFPKLEISA